MTKKTSSILPKTLALLAICTLAFTLLACGNQGRDIFAGTYVWEEEVQQQGLLGSSTQTVSASITLKKDGTLIMTSNSSSVDFSKYDSLTWDVGDSCLIFKDGEEEMEIQTSDDGSRLFFFGKEFIKQ